MQGVLKNPLRLTWLALAGAVLAAAASLVIMVHLPAVPAHPCGFWAALWARRLRGVMLLPVVVGLVLALWAERRVKRGIANERWTELELAPVRRLASARIWAVLGAVGMTAWIGTLIVEGFRAGSGLLYLLVVPSQVAARIERFTKPKLPAPTSAPTRSRPPLQSEHWGRQGV